jgi:hypothetical protein
LEGSAWIKSGTIMKEASNSTSLSLSKTSQTSCSCYFRFLEKMRMSSVHQTTKSSRFSWKTSFMRCWKMTSAFISSKGIITYSKWP